MKKDNDDCNLNRRSFLTKSAVTALGVTAATATAGFASSALAQTKPHDSTTDNNCDSDRKPAKSVQEIRRTGTKKLKKPNVLFILTDQESFLYEQELPKDYNLSARQRVKNSGVTFTNHQINSAICTSSRSVIYTGRHIQETGMFDNCGLSGAPSLGKQFPTIGHLLTQNDYYTVYKGKWHLSNKTESFDRYAKPDEKYNKILESYGFKDYVGIGDVIGQTNGAYYNDGLTAEQAKRWMRLKGQDLNNKEDKSWFLALNLTNPHDVMFYNADKKDETIQTIPKPLMEIARDPEEKRYKKQWDFTLPKSRNENLELAGRIPAHAEYAKVMQHTTGNNPIKDDRIQRRRNYYFNSIKETDRLLNSVFDELENLGLADDTIIIMTSDHGELGGAHGLHGKGATAYREQVHVPLLISHPLFPATYGQECSALSSHIDLVPSILEWTQTRPDTSKDPLGAYKGHSLTPLIQKGNKAKLTQIRPATLYNFNMLTYLDANVQKKHQEFMNNGGTAANWEKNGTTPDLKKRGAIRTINNGEFKFSRYFSPIQYNLSTTLDEILSKNDVELFDLKNDPLETNNLALKPDENKKMLVTMNKLLTQLIAQEVSVPDDGSSFDIRIHGKRIRTRYDI